MIDIKPLDQLFDNRLVTLSVIDGLARHQLLGATMLAHLQRVDAMLTVVTDLPREQVLAHLPDPQDPRVELVEVIPYEEYGVLLGLCLKNRYDSKEKANFTVWL
jgi:hypothetical protein